MFRSTRLSVLNKHCPWALKLHDEGVPRVSTIRFNPGIAAHAILQFLAEHRPETDSDVEMAANAVAEKLIGSVRKFDGVPDPPMQPDEAFEGRDMALTWYYIHGLPPKGQVEIGLGMDRDGKPCLYEDAYYKAAVDLVYMDFAGDEDDPVEMVVVRDWKSSWLANENELHTVQRRGQAALAWMHYPNVSIVRREVANIRTGSLYYEDTWLDDQGVRQMREWRDDILKMCCAAEKQMENPRPAPGIVCSGCPWAYRCEHNAIATIQTVEDGDVERLAEEYAVAKSRSDALGSIVRKACDRGVIKIPDGGVGYFCRVSLKPKPEIGKILLDRWLEMHGKKASDLGEAEAIIESMLAALRLGKKSLDAIAMVLYPARGPDKVDNYKEMRTQLLRDCMQEEGSSVFEVRRG